MALVSPGVQVSVIDQSQYAPSVASSVPYILLVTAQDKPAYGTSGVAQGTLKSNANKLYLITSQEELLATFGTPYFYTTADGTPVNGYELNEYGLLAAYSALGQTTRCYIQRADVDLSRLVGTTVRPSNQSLIAEGSYWFDTASSKFGFVTWNNSGNTFVDPQFSVTVLNDTTNLNTGTTQPKQSYGKLWDVTVVTVGNQVNFYQKVGFDDATYGTVNKITGSSWSLTDVNNSWQPIGSSLWAKYLPVAVGDYVPDREIRPGGANAYINSANVNVTGYSMSTLMDSIRTLNYSIGGVMATNQQNKDLDTRLSVFVNMDTIPKDNSATPSPYAGGLSWRWQYPEDGTDLIGLSQGLYGFPRFAASPNAQAPQWAPYRVTPETKVFNWTNPPWIQYAATNSIWQITDNVSARGTDLMMKQKVDGEWTRVPLPCFSTAQEATYTLDRKGGGKNIPTGTLFSQYNYYQSSFQPLASMQFRRRKTTGPTVVVTPAINPTFSTYAGKMYVSWTQAGSNVFSSEVLMTIMWGTGSSRAPAESFCRGFNWVTPNFLNSYVNEDGKIVIVHQQGGDIRLRDYGPELNVKCLPRLGYDTYSNSQEQVTVFNPSYTGTNGLVDYGLVLSNWIAPPYWTYVASDTVPTLAPAAGTPWFYDTPTQVDIMIQSNGAWRGYRTVSSTIRGENLTLTNPTGPIFSVTAPTTQTTGMPLQPGDLWIDTSPAGLSAFPVISRWTAGSPSKWVKINNLDNGTPNGILFADARWAPNGTTNPITDPIPSIQSLLVSNYTDIDAPNPALYARGMLLFNTRRSANNVKTYQPEYFTAANFPNKTLPTQPATWVTALPNKSSGVPYFSTYAQRQYIVTALKKGIDTGADIREEQRQFNIIACPQYPELAPNMVTLNADRGETAFVVVDTPLNLTPADVVTWATNNNGLGLPNGNGLLTGSPYAATFYPSCQTTDLTGLPVIQPPSHMILRTLLRNDYIAYPWMAPAGQQRGLVDNAELIGYIDESTDKFVTIGVNQALRDVLYTNRINPITIMPDTGIVNFGNKTTTGVLTAMDRINVARLVAFLRKRLAEIASSFAFEPNDQITRNNIRNAIDSLMVDLVAKRALNDYLVVCDLSNNTPDRIDRNELWVDVAVEPVKSVEFIYVPVRVVNTGAITRGL